MLRAYGRSRATEDTSSKIGSRFRASAHCKMVAFSRTPRWVKVNMRLCLDFETDHLGLKTACTTSGDLHHNHDKTASTDRVRVNFWPRNLAPGYIQPTFASSTLYYSGGLRGVTIRMAFRTAWPLTTFQSKRRVFHLRSACASSIFQSQGIGGLVFAIQRCPLDKCSSEA